MDETYIKIKGQCRYLYRAADSSGQTIDKIGTNTAELTELNPGKSQGEAIKVRQSPYLKNLVEQVNRNIKC